MITIQSVHRLCAHHALASRFSCIEFDAYDRHTNFEVKALTLDIFHTSFRVLEVPFFSIVFRRRDRHAERSLNMYSNRMYLSIIGSNRNMGSEAKTSTSHEGGGSKE